MFSVLLVAALAADPQAEVDPPAVPAKVTRASVEPRLLPLARPQDAPRVPAPAPPPRDPAPDLTTPLPYRDALPAAPAGVAPGDLEDRHLGPPASVWAEVNYLLYRLKSTPPSAPLLTAPGDGGRIIAGDPVGFGPTSGGSFAAGLWLNDRHTLGLAVNGFLLEQRSAAVTASSDAAGGPLLTRPFTDALLAQPAQVFVANPGRLAGSFAATSGARVSGLGAAVTRNLIQTDALRVDFRVGGRYLDLDEYEEVTQSSRTLDGSLIRLAGQTGTDVAIRDRFRTRNQYYGGAVGLRGEYVFGLVFAGLSSEVGLGNNHQTVAIDGSSVYAGTPASARPGGLLALPGANVGRVSADRLALLTDLGAHVGVRLTERSRLTVGYQFLYVNEVVRPASQIDPVVNTRLVPTNPTFGGVSGIASPVVTGKRDDFYLHGVRFGLELAY